MTNITFLGAGLGFGVNPLNNNHYTKPAQAITTAREKFSDTYLPPATYHLPPILFQTFDPVIHPEIN